MENKIVSDELLDALENIQKESIENYSIRKMIDGEPKNINPLTHIPKSQMKLYGFSRIINSVFFDTEKELLEWIKNNDTSFVFGYLCIIDYLGQVADKSDVIKVTYSNGKYDLLTACDENGYGKYNNERSIYKGEYVWEYEYGNISDMYSAFRDRGIILDNDIYEEITERDKELLKLCKEFTMHNMKNNKIY